MQQAGCRLVVLLFASFGFAQESAPELFSAAEKLRLEAKTHREAIPLYARAAELWKQLHEVEPEARARWRLGQLLDLTGERAKALDEFRAGLTTLGDAGDNKLKAGLHYGMARVLVATGAANQGIEHYERALALRRVTGERFEQALALHNLGSTQWSLGRNPEALSAYREAMALRKEIADEMGVAYTLFGLASVEYTWGEVEKALLAYEEALGIWRKLKNPRGEADTLNSIGLMYVSLGELRQARSRYAQALGIWRKLGDAVGEAYTLSNLGMVEGAAGKGSFEKALAVLREKNDRRGQAYVLHNLAGLTGDLALYEESLAIKRQLGDRYGEAQTLEKLAEAYLKAGRTDDAVRVAAEAVEMQEAVGNRLGQAASEAVRARALRQAGRLNDARPALEAAVDLIEGLRAGVVSPELRGAFFATQQRVYREAISLLMALKDERAAFAMSERSRARLLLDRVLAARETRAEDQTWVARERALTREIHTQAQRLQRLSGGAPGPVVLEARRNLDGLFEQWRKLHADRAVNAGTVASIEAIQRQMPDARTALVEYALDDEGGWAWVLTRDRLRAVRMPKRKTVEALVARLRTSIARRASDAVASEELHRLLIAPLGAMPGVSRLVVVPDAPLDHLSFQALGNTLDRFEVVELPSAATLVGLRAMVRPAAKQKLSVVADPVFDASDPRLKGNTDFLASERKSDYGRLHFSRIEAAEILKLAPAGTAIQWTGLEATRSLMDQAAIRESSIVHLATHATVDASRPELSAVIFSQVDAQGRPRNGHLRLYEIYNLRLAAQLVVLSGCSTAVGTELNGEGAMSLTRGFLYAGAAKVLASQWEVEDRATAELMRRFYEGLLKERLAAGAALRKAQLSMRADPRWKDPYFWAGFHLQGDWR